MGVGVKDLHGNWVLLNGNQTAVLAFNYLMEARKARGVATPNDMVVKTIVTSDMIDVLASHYGVHCYNVLTGFKWIAELIREKEGREHYIIGGEESYGLMVGDKVRDKDAVTAVAIMCEMAAYERSKGRTLYEKLLDLYVQCGLYKESLISLTKKGMHGQEEIAAMMDGWPAGTRLLLLRGWLVKIHIGLPEGRSESNLSQAKRFIAGAAQIQRIAAPARGWNENIGATQWDGAEDQILFQRECAAAFRIGVCRGGGRARRENPGDN